MNATTDILRGELERLFELDELKKLSDELLGLDPETVGGTDGKGAFARALVEACKSDDSLLALADALLLSKDGVDAKVEALFDAQPGEELKAGAEVVGCRILKKLGEGGVGVVYLAEKKADDGEKLRVALKVLRPVHTRDRSAARRFLTVARIHKGLESKSLAPVVDVDSNPDNPVIGDRSFASTPARVSAHARAFVAAMQQSGLTVLRLRDKFVPGWLDGVAVKS